MSGSERQPGDVAIVRVGSEYPPEIAVKGRGIFADKWYVGGPRLGSQHGWHEHNIETLRHLVVIDPEDVERVRGIRDLVCALAGTDPSDFPAEWRVRDALREFANPTPAEPTDPRARVTDRRENIWRLLADGEWVCTSGPDIGEYIAWARLAAEYGPVSIESES